METQLDLSILCLTVAGPDLVHSFPAVMTGSSAKSAAFISTKLYLDEEQLLQLFWSFMNESEFRPMSQYFIKT